VLRLKKAARDRTVASSSHYRLATSDVESTLDSLTICISHGFLHPCLVLVPSCASFPSPCSLSILLAEAQLFQTYMIQKRTHQ
jgi:hypothetical protein